MSIFNFLKSDSQDEPNGVGVGGLDEPIEKEIIDPNKAAFPCPSGCYSDCGISVRAHFAVQLMAAKIIADKVVHPSVAVKLADELIKELNK